MNEPNGQARHHRRTLWRRLLPLYCSAFLGGVSLWAPIEKLFMVSIGFDAASLGLMAALYALVVPVCEVPSGILADRWSRRGVLLLAVLAAAVSVTIGALSHNVASYIVSTLFLGLYFALQSGTTDAVAYDTVLEETGNSDIFEVVIGRFRLVESAALLGSALLGAALADLLSLRATYLLTLIPLAGAALALLRFREPRLHQLENPEPFRRQLTAAYGTVLRRGPLRQIVILLVLAAVLLQSMLEFGPWWLVVLEAPTFGYGLHWAGLTAALGLGGLLGSSRAAAGRGGLALTAVAVAAAVTLSLSGSLPVVIVAQIVLATAMVAIGIPLTRRLHDALDSSVRTSVASGVGALSWLAFVPFALVLGQLSQQAGVGPAGGVLALTVAAVGATLLGLIRIDRREPIPQRAGTDERKNS